MATTTHNGKRNEGINAKAHRKENNFQEEYNIVSFEGGEFKQPVTLRIYGTAAKNYACVWCNDERLNYSTGSGSAGGYGYHRPSAAADEALRKAGFSFDPIDGRGTSAIFTILQSIAKDVLKLDQFTIIHSHA